MTVKEAATYLGVSIRTIRTYVESGYLATYKFARDRKHYLDALQIEEFRKDREEVSGGTIISRKDFLQMKAEVRRLRAELDVVLQILDTKMEPLHLTSAYALELLPICRQQLHQSKWELAEIEPWLGIFLRVNEDDFKTLADATKDIKPWKPFLQLCMAMTIFVANHPTYSTSLEMQAIHRQLAEGRRRLRISALIYSETYSGMDQDLSRYAFADAPGSVADTLTKVLRHKK
jgi:excisionase family DNA binding protein